MQIATNRCCAFCKCTSRAAKDNSQAISRAVSVPCTKFNRSLPHFMYFVPSSQLRNDIQVPRRRAVEGQPLCPVPVEFWQTISSRGESSPKLRRHVGRSILQLTAGAAQ
jgi:hypothetical protein